MTRLSMMKSTPLALAMALFGSLCLIWPHAACADSPNTVAPTTLEEQISVLEGALSEGMVSQDWKMIEMAVKGLESSGLKGTDLELLMLRVERNAAFQAMRKYSGINPAQIETFGLAIRAKLGDSVAHAKLHGWGFDDLTEVKPADPSVWKNQPAEAAKQNKIFIAYRQDVTRRDYALQVLGLLREPGVADRSVTLLRSGSTDVPGALYMGMSNSGDALIVAALAAEPEAGLKKLQGICADDKESLSAQTRILQNLVQLRSTVTNPVIALGSDPKFSFRGEVAAALPKELLTTLIKPYTAMVQRWKYDEKQQGNDTVLNGLIAIAGSCPKGVLDKDALAALRALKDRAGDQRTWIKQQIDQVLKTQGIDPTAAQKPPAPPADF